MVILLGDELHEQKTSTFSNELRSHKCYNCVIMQTPPPLPPEVFLPKEVRLDPGTEQALLET